RCGWRRCAASAASPGTCASAAAARCRRRRSCRSPIPSSSACRPWLLFPPASHLLPPPQAGEGVKATRALLPPPPCAGEGRGGGPPPRSGPGPVAIFTGVPPVAPFPAREPSAPSPARGGRGQGDACVVAPPPVRGGGPGWGQPRVAASHAFDARPSASSDSAQHELLLVQAPAPSARD